MTEPVLKFRIGEQAVDTAGGLLSGVQQKLEQLRARVQGLRETKADKESPTLANTVTVEGFTPTTVWREVDALGALIGLFRVRTDLGGWKLQRNTAVAPAAEFSTAQDVLAVDASGNVVLRPAASVTPANNGDLVVQATSNTSLTFKLKGTDGVVRSGSLTLA